ncbi:HAMP domain-containing histidine kinase [Thalassotalea sp. M1531]|uniref:histidine kinase n=1 Tax=Thalassotalea algicola TaxID=2716224 RepID=A0A7Y0L919_9GAMM|nr:HAMP domain-containing sensor histidine kinase [Thalassotalea algicola]NMP30204.1 HAMP domain-containing histidine kinase [Thalassotalea algicola]
MRSFSASSYQLKKMLSNLSVKRMTVLGFALVMTPLFVTLLYMAEQTKAISTKGSESILSVSELIDANRALNQSLTRIERFASQYIVLKDPELLERFSVEQFKLDSIIDKQLMTFGDIELNQELTNLTNQLSFISQLLPDLPEEFNELIEVEKHFKSINTHNNKIRQRTNLLIQEAAIDIRNQANNVDEVILKSLLIVPISMAIAAIFIHLITAPLKRLITNIKRLEQGKFEQEINSTGSSEVREIALALDTMRSRLHALELQKSSFIRHISHELKTPLAAIREGSSLLSDHSLGALNNGQQEVSDIIVGNVNRLQQLIEDLLSFNVVLDSSSLQDAEKVYIAPLIENIVEQHKLEINRKNIITELVMGSGYILCNRKQLTVIIENLLSNAIKFQEQNGKITISASINNLRLTIAVQDTGLGISDNELPLIFDAFYQGQSNLDNTIKSSGLGLTIVKELVMRLNGSIDVSSNLPKSGNTNKGTIFTVTLPKAFTAESSS